MARGLAAILALDLVGHSSVEIGPIWLVPQRAVSVLAVGS